MSSKDWWFVGDCVIVVVSVIIVAVGLMGRGLSRSRRDGQPWWW